MVDEARQATPSQEFLTLTERELFDRLGWFTQIRWAMGLFFLLALLVSWHILGVRFHHDGAAPSMAPAVSAVLIIFLYNALFVFLVRIIKAKGRISHRAIVALALSQIVCDLLSVCALIHYTGGTENLFIILLLVPLVVATELMPQKLAYAAAGGAAMLLNALAWGEQQGILPHVEASSAYTSADRSGLHSDPLYVLEVTGALTVTMFAMVFVASTIAGRLRRREDELEQAYRRLHLADEAKSFFMRKAGHELRAPLAAIHNVLDALAVDCRELPEQHRRLIWRTQQRTRGLLAVVSDLRKYSRLRSPQEITARDRLSMSDVTRNTVELFHKQAQAAGVTVELASESLHVEGDEELLGELVTNLVANAVQYTPRGGSVRVSLTAAPPWAVLTVADTGIGISQEAQKRLFEEFYRAPEARQLFQEGTGLGLAICKRIVEMHGGSIEAAPGPQVGTVITVRLPVAGGQHTGGHL